MIINYVTEVVQGDVESGGAGVGGGGGVGGGLQAAWHVV